MKVDTTLTPTSLSAIPELAQAAETMGFNAIWIPETQHDPFLPGALIAEHTKRIQFGTAVAIAFARSPATLAYKSWDLSEFSNGRFILGLGTQVKAHIERRFGMRWPKSPVKQLREILAAIRAIWNTWQSGGKLNYRGEYYRITLMTPFFNPGPTPHHQIPIFIAGVNTGLARLAGTSADGFLVHPYHSPGYLREVILPAIEAGLNKMGRARKDVQIKVTAMVATTSEEREFTRSQIAFYASTPSYRRVMAHHGWEGVAKQLSAFASQKKWEEMTSLITDEMLSTFAGISSPNDLPLLLNERYEGLADRISLYTSFTPGERDPFWRNLINHLSA